VPMPKSGRQLILDRLYEEVRTATTADLQRAASFLEFARQVRRGCTKQRSNSRRSQRNSWRKGVDDSITW
jgi:hypothetical protein